MKRSGVIAVTESELNGTNTKRNGTERRRKEIITETRPAPRNHLTKVISMRLKLRFVCP